MKFAHLADVHIGAWRDPRMKELPILAFEKACITILERNVDFVVIAGDLFNTSLPPLDHVKRAVAVLQKFRGAGLGVYAIAGSHDYSPSGKTMLDVLEEAGLLVNVMKGSVVEINGKRKLRLSFTIDSKTGVKLTGILGRAGSLDREYYEDLDREALEMEEGQKVFLFHAAITELKPKGTERMESTAVSYLPKGFDYYAGGHVHITEDLKMDGYPFVVYPGPLFPASFSEIEELKCGSFCFFENGNLERVQVKLKEPVVFHVNAEKKSAQEVNVKLQEIAQENVKEKIVLLRVFGKLTQGVMADLSFKECIRTLYDSGAFYVLKNTTKLTSKEFEEFQTTHSSTEDVEERVIKEHVGQVKIGSLDAKEETALTKELMQILGEEQHEGEKKYEYQERVLAAARSILEK